MKIGDIYKSNSEKLKADDLMGKDVTVTIESVETVTFDDGDKLVLSFRGKDKGMVLNKTNAETIGDMHGDDTDYWPGKTITIYPTKTEFGGKRVPCLRIRENAPSSNGAQHNAPPPPRQEPVYESIDDEVPF